MMAKLRWSIETFELEAPFAIAGRVETEAAVLMVSLQDGWHVGRGEGDGVYYFGETAETMASQVEGLASEIERTPDPGHINRLLPPGGARNALDCAAWDLKAKSSGVSVWSRLGLKPAPMQSVYTIGIKSPEAMADQAARRPCPILKLKLDADRPIERTEAVRRARPDVRLIVDANQGWTFEELKEFAGPLNQLGVEMIEQPLPRGQDDALAGFKSPVLLGADESCQTAADLPYCAERYGLINVKLDKTGGLTEALDLARMTRDAGLELMVGNMLGTSLAMAPCFAIAAHCRYLDIDGPLLLARDIKYGLTFGRGGMVSPPSRELWG